ncbi:MAG: prolipoprotein diacylglyceryl transferase [Phycisphaerales bacterium]
MHAAPQVSCGRAWKPALPAADRGRDRRVGGEAALGHPHQKRAGTRDARLAIVFFAALVGAFLGAKVAFLVAEGWHHRDDWLALLSGRSVTGALIGGTLAAEYAKWRFGVVAATGDVFAVTVPLAVAIGRVGCVSAGCCQGVACDAAWWTVVDADGHARVPSAQIELGFNLAFLSWALTAARFGWMPTQRFNLYLMAYGVFRFVHEYWRDDHRWTEAFGGYHAAALAVFVAGAWMFRRRARLNALVSSTAAGTAAQGA